VADEYKNFLMFLSFLRWTTDINQYVSEVSGPAEKHKYPSYVSRTTDVYKLCTLVLKLKNIFLNMNISFKEHKKLVKECLFSVVHAC
jgi:hypothetical protein